MAQRSWVFVNATVYGFFRAPQPKQLRNRVILAVLSASRAARPLRRGKALHRRNLWKPLRGALLACAAAPMASSGIRTGNQVVAGVSLCGYGIRTLRSCEPERDISCKSWDLHKALIVNNLRICHDLLSRLQLVVRKLITRRVQMASSRIMRRPEVELVTGLSKATLYRMVSSGALARPVRVSARCVGWYAEEIDQFLASRERAGSLTAAPKAEGDEPTERK